MISGPFFVLRYARERPLRQNIQSMPVHAA
jgi:hypothetical protein